MARGRIFTPYMRQNCSLQRRPFGILSMWSISSGFQAGPSLLFAYTSVTTREGTYTSVCEFSRGQPFGPINPIAETSLFNYRVSLHTPVSVGYYRARYQVLWQRLRPLCQFAHSGPAGHLQYSFIQDTSFEFGATLLDMPTARTNGHFAL